MNFTSIKFDKLSSNIYNNRYLGGSELEANVHPYVKGYFYTIFELPDIFNDTDEANVQKTLLSAAEGFTPPGDRQLKTEDIMGMGGLDATFVTGQQIDRNFSIQYRDYWGAPIFRIHRQWTSIINPYAGGVIKTSTNQDSVNNFESKAYKGKLWVIETKPVLGNSDKEFTEDDVQKVFYFDGVFPRTDLISAYDSNITDNSVVRPNVQYSFDGFPLDETDPVIVTNALTKLNALTKIDNAGSKSSYKVFSDLIG